MRQLEKTEDTGAQGSRRTEQKVNRKRKKAGGFFQRLKPVMDGLLSRLEEALMIGMEEVPGERSERIWVNVACPAIVQLVVNKHEVFVRNLLGKDVSSWDLTKLAFIRIQWMIARRKTKAETEERSVQDCAIRVYKNLQLMTDKAGPEEDWTTRGIEFGEAMGELLRILEAVETGVEADDYPRAMYQASIEKAGQREMRRQEERQEGAGERAERGQGQPRGGLEPGEGAEGQRQPGTTEQQEGDAPSTRQFPQSPAPRRLNPDTRADGWRMGHHRLPDHHVVCSAAPGDADCGNNSQLSPRRMGGGLERCTQTETISDDRGRKGACP